MKGLLLVGVVALLVGSSAQSQWYGSANNPGGGERWGPGPSFLPKGAKLAVISGNPGAAGPFVIRLRFPPGYAVPPHSHPADEHVTVIQGALELGMGANVHSRTQILHDGASIVAPANMNHFASTAVGATVQISMRGPFAINYANPRDDPRRR